VKLLRLVALVGAVLTSVARADLWSEYIPLYERAGAIFGVAGAGKDGWWGAWNSWGDGRFIWKNPHTGEMSSGGIERFSVRNCSGTEWVVLESFDWSVVTRLRIETIKATVSDLHTGNTFDVSKDCGVGPVGHPYALQKLMPWSYRIRIWGRIYAPNSTTQVLSMFYWESDIFPPEPRLNECMGVTVPAIRQTEVWAGADTAGRVTEWAAGTGSPPFDAMGRPIVPMTTHDRTHWAGKGYGTVYRLQINGAPLVCMIHRWNW
jgi:hypothetical protein